MTDETTTADQSLVELPAGSYDVESLNKDLEAALALPAGDERDAAIAKAVSNNNETKQEDAAFPGMKRVTRVTTYREGQPDEFKITESVLVLDIEPPVDAEQDQPTAEAPAAQAAAPATPNPSEPAAAGEADDDHHADA